MAYRVNSDRVAAEARNLSGAALRHFNACLAQIAADPHPRTGYYVERVIPIPPLPMRTYLYQITEETSISDELVFVFTAEFFPEYALVYVVDEQQEEVVVFYLRRGIWD